MSARPRKLWIIPLLMLATSGTTIPANGEGTLSELTGAHSITAVTDIAAAREWCATTMLHRVEGLWEFPDDQTIVLIRRSPVAHRYDIVVADTPDTRLHPGEIIGYVQESAAADKFEMNLCSRWLGKEGGQLTKCMAQLVENDSAIVVKGRKIKFGLRGWWILPSFWKMINLSWKDPLENLPKGMIRVYPSTRRQPDYL
ncbi:MAG: hypothetical protein K2N88_03305 [Muribaculaceae bacterium]|nr:hypothetical protein [Muribaculaceae bacterium]